MSCEWFKEIYIKDYTWGAYKISYHILTTEYNFLWNKYGNNQFYYK